MPLVAKLKSWSQELTPYFVYLLLTATLGPLLFGYHLVRQHSPAAEAPMLSSVWNALELANALPGRAKCSTTSHHLRRCACQTV
jgi:hypothetical protein